MKTNFRITDGKGFGLTFENGWTVSVQWGWGNYCDNFRRSDLDYAYSRDGYATLDAKCGKEGSHTAECAVIDPAGVMVHLPAFMFTDGVDYTDRVSNRSTPAQVLALMNWAAGKEKG